MKLLNIFEAHDEPPHETNTCSSLPMEVASHSEPQLSCKRSRASRKVRSNAKRQALNLTAEPGS